jgi:hypothetical protein
MIHSSTTQQVNKMMNSNWMVTLAVSQRKALIGFGYTTQQVNAMSLAETTEELKTLGYNFKTNSPFKNK